MNDFERHHAMKIKSEVVRSIPVEFRDGWASVAVWLWLSPDSRGIGGGAQVYDALGYARGFTFPVHPLLQAVRKLRAVGTDLNAAPWATVLLQFGRRDEDLRLTFELDDPYRWAVASENYRTLIHEMRPDFRRVISY